MRFVAGICALLLGNLSAISCRRLHYIKGELDYKRNQTRQVVVEQLGSWSGASSREEKEPDYTKTIDTIKAVADIVKGSANLDDIINGEDKASRFKNGGALLGSIGGLGCVVATGGTYIAISGFLVIAGAALEAYGDSQSESDRDFMAKAFANIDAKLNDIGTKIDTLMDNVAKLTDRFDQVDEKLAEILGDTTMLITEKHERLFRQVRAVYSDMLKRRERMSQDDVNQFIQQATTLRLDSELMSSAQLSRWLFFLKRRTSDALAALKYQDFLSVRIQYFSVMWMSAHLSESELSIPLEDLAHDLEGYQQVLQKSQLFEWASLDPDELEKYFQPPDLTTREGNCIDYARGHAAAFYANVTKTSEPEETRLEAAKWFHEYLEPWRMNEPPFHIPCHIHGLYPTMMGDRFRKVMRNDPNAAIRAAFVSSMGLLGSTARHFITEERGHLTEKQKPTCPKDVQRNPAANSAMEDLIQALADPSPLVRASAAVSMFRVGFPAMSHKYNPGQFFTAKGIPRPALRRVPAWMFLRLVACGEGKSSMFEDHIHVRMVALEQLQDLWIWDPLAKAEIPVDKKIEEKCQAARDHLWSGLDDQKKRAYQDFRAEADGGMHWETCPPGGGTLVGNGLKSCYRGLSQKTNLTGSPFGTGEPFPVLVDDCE